MTTWFKGLLKPNLGTKGEERTSDEVSNVIRYVCLQIAKDNRNPPLRPISDWLSMEKVQC